MGTKKSKIISDEDLYLKMFNGRYAVTMLGSKATILVETTDPVTGFKDVQFTTPTDLRLLYKNQPVFKTDGKGKTKPVNPVDIWLAHPDRRAFQGVVFMPQAQCNGYYNLDTGFAVKPEPGDCDLYKAHIQDVICNGNEAHFTWLWDWCASLIQSPANRPGTAVVLRGPQGTGKGGFAVELGKLLGPHFAHVTGQDQLVGRFNNHLKAALLVYVDEAYFAGSRQDTGKFKAIITEDTVYIERKFHDSIPLKNHMRVIMASNSDWVCPADIDERRFAVFDISDRRQKDYKYFGAIIEQMENGGREALLYELLHHNIKSNLREIPRTQALFSQMVSTMPSVQRWWVNCLYAEKIGIKDANWPKELPKEELYLSYSEFCDQDHIRYRAARPQFWRRLYKLCPVLTVRRPAGLPRVICFPYLEQARELIAAKTGVEIDWDIDPS